MSQAKIKTSGRRAMALLIALMSTAHGEQKRTPAISVAVIAPSVSTALEARRVMAYQGWSEGKLKTADAILVIVRSSLTLPLRASYAFISELKEDAERQMNISGPNFHIYLYHLGDDLECRELKHISYRAE